jgi:TRAP-type C4-dicarboxylate transport system permease small subunit
MLKIKKQKLPSKDVFYSRLWKNAVVGILIMTFCLSIGILGYKFTIPEMDWYDSLLNASMILSGMGPMIDPNIVLTKTAKVFASLYALFSGVAFISTIGILIAPIAHRFFHKLHIEDSSGNE